MMIKLLGSIFIVVGATAFGLGKGLQYYRQISQLRELLGAIEIIKCEMNYTMLPIPKVMEMTSQRIGGACGRFFSAYAQGLEKGRTRKAAMEDALESTKKLCLPNDAIFALMDLCASLGRYDIDGENRILQLSGQRIRCAYDKVENEKRPLIKSYAVLGFSTGMALVILLI